jgi:hypothetical protein
MLLYLAMAIGFVVASLSDWLFMGVLFHDRYKVFPEVWRDAKDERTRILIAQGFSAMTSVGFVLLASKLQLVRLEPAIALAAMIWIIGPLPLLLGNHLFIKLDPGVTASHAIGWLIKLLLIGCVTAALL